VLSNQRKRHPTRPGNPRCPPSARWTAVRASLGQSAQQPDQRHPADSAHQASGQAGASPSAERQRDHPQRLTGRYAPAVMANR
jgi:hypothetical protein